MKRLSKYDFGAEYRQRVIAELCDQGRVTSVPKLKYILSFEYMLDVSESTLRRDLTQLQAFKGQWLVGKRRKPITCYQINLLPDDAAPKTDVGTPCMYDPPNFESTTRMDGRGNFGHFSPLKPRL